MRNESMGEKHNNKGFWDHYARLYDFEINRFSGDVLTLDMDVLEIATETGLIAVNIAAHTAICANQHGT